MNYTLLTSYYYKLQAIYPKRPLAFSCRLLSLCTAFIMMLHCLTMSEKPGWSGDIRMSVGRFREEQSRMNCVNSLGEGLARMLFCWSKYMIVFKRVGSLSDLVLAVALHPVRIWE